MTERTISQHFAHALHAPFVNVNWSWGSIREDGAIFLRCGDDDYKRTGDGNHLFTIYRSEAIDSLGRRERRKHIDKIICEASPSFIVMYIRGDKNNKEYIKDYDKTHVWKISSLIQTESGDVQAMISAKLPIKEI